MNKSKAILITLLINVCFPYLVYTLLKPHTRSVIALTCAAFVPMVDSIYGLLKYRKLDAFSSFIFFGLVLSIIAAIIGGDERFILIRESYVTGIMGLLFLASLFFAKPLIYYFAVRFSEDKEAIAKRWQEKPPFQRSLWVMTLVWGISLVLEAGIKVLLVYTLSIPVFLIVSPFVQYGLIGLTILWNVIYVKRRRQRVTEDHV
jgi:hypothetical protein